MSLFVLQPAEKKPALATRQAVDNKQKASIVKPKLPAISESARRQQEEKLKLEAEKRHNSLLEEWKKKISALESTLSSSNKDEEVNNQESTPQAAE